jgi:hypothetical protein
MFDLKSTTQDAPAVATQIITFRNDGNLPPVVIVENLDGSASAAIKYQERDSGAWADIAGTNATINPGTSNAQIISGATLREIALHAGGNVKLLVHVGRQEDGEASDLGNIK